MIESAIQGHPYLYLGQKTIALSFGTRPKILILDEKDPNHWQTTYVRVACLTPLPLRYLHGEFPK